MTTTNAAPAFLDHLSSAAIDAERAEAAFRDSIARALERHERARQFAFRRLDIARTMADKARSCTDTETAVAAQTAALKTEFGWHGDSPRNRAIFEAWRPVALAIWDAVAPAKDQPPSRTAVAEAMQTFEAWYEKEHGSSCLAILDHEMPEIPVVEF